MKQKHHRENLSQEKRTFLSPLFFKTRSPAVGLTRVQAALPRIKFAT